MRGATLELLLNRWSERMSDQQSLLLQLKNSLTFDSTLSLRLVQWNQRTDCCTWSGVDCDMAGRIPIEISSLTRLVALDLSCYWRAGLQLENPNLKVLVQNFSELRELYLDGVVISAHGNEWGQALSSSLPNLQVLSLSNCYLSGPIHSSLADLQSLSVIRLDGNDLSSPVPEFLADFPSLTILSLADCGLYGQLPENIFKAMMVDEQKVQSQLQHLQFEITGGNQPYQDAVTVTMKGLELELVKILTVFTSIDLSSNNFQGLIPEELGLFKSLIVLNLSHNAFIGSIPSSVGNLRQLESLDLSMNNLHRHIPIQLANLNFLSVLNLSYNHFVGRIPTSTQLQSFSPTSFEGNEGLCGPPLTNSCTNSNESTISSPSNQFDPSKPVSSNEFDWKFFLVIGVGFGIGFVAAVAPLIFSDKVNLWYDIIVHKFLRHFCM
ncbi:hypothetical protein EZV62_016671 [Acer yangbiense]|uniref:Leucine-rich repeat-containing N-terminal plant-type domain-containing protein n=1 Tax=Acer yangbiense TaxID=1000413 RepID=A0A5C7HRK1_9ROSI|nr:hypothetical protein EZV62_016671 [Acer yangbiense]